MIERFKDILARTPTSAGVYLMRDDKRRIFYIGKAKNLKARLRSYFLGSDSRPFVRRLSRILKEVETVLTQTEKEALLLESSLIKVHQPRHNIRLRDDKNYLSLRIDTNAQWPRVEVVRRLARDGARYFGPYHRASALRQTLRVLNRYFGLRTCSDASLANRSRPCLQYQIKRCPGPCVLEVDRESYLGSVKNAILFLEGRHEELLESLRERMVQAAERWEYEAAAHYRDQIRDIERSLERQGIEVASNRDQDVFGCYREGDCIVFELLSLRQGQVVGTRRFAYRDQDFPEEELLTSLLLQYYDEHAGVPDEVLVPVKLEALSALGEILSERRGRKTSILWPRRGHRRALLERADLNARQAFQEIVDKREHQRVTLEKLQAKFRLPTFPGRIECFDISNLQGTSVVGSMVVFIDGEPDRASYRTFKVKSVAGQDDFASLVEVVSRRVQRSLAGKEPWPDLVVIDGGKGQLNAVLAACRELGAAELSVLGLAKSRPAKGEAGGLEPKKAASEERVFLPGIKDPIILRPHTAERYLLERIRDEAHRVAITYHQKLRRRGSLSSALNTIPGLGESRRRALLAHFKSLSRIRAASMEELMEVNGIGPWLARGISCALGSDE